MDRYRKLFDELRAMDPAQRSVALRLPANSICAFCAALALKMEMLGMTMIVCLLIMLRSLQTPYFPELETPSEIGHRAMDCAADVASELSFAGQKTALLVQTIAL